jgi:hypothetical protein
METTSTVTLTMSINSLIDEAGAIDHEIKSLEKKLSSIKATLKAQGAGRYNGSHFEALVYSSEGKLSIDWKAIAEKLNPSRQLITAHTSIGAASVSIKFSKV